VRGGWTAAGGRLKGVSAIQIGGSDHGAAEDGRKVSSYKEKGFAAVAAKNALNPSEASIEIFNGVPYVVFLELGSSQQAPAGFVRISLRELMAVMTAGEARRVEAAMRLANIKARAVISLKQGAPARNVQGRYNLSRRV